VNPSRPGRDATVEAEQDTIALKRDTETYRRKIAGSSKAA
jgi:hypothetical protein